MIRFFNPLWFVKIMTFYGVGDIIGAGASIAGGLMGSNAAESGSKAQTKAAQMDIAEQKRQYDLARSDTAPYRGTGSAANDLLAEYLGLDYGGGATQGDAGFTPLTYDQWAKSQQKNGLSSSAMRYLAKNWTPQMSDVGYGVKNPFRNDTSYSAYQKYLDANPARAAIPARTGSHGANYGSLLKNFSQDDLNNDVVYNNGLQFGLDEGIKGLNRMTAAHGGFDSGATLKALARYANDYGTTKASDAYNRFQNNKDFIYNSLSGVANRGVNAVGTVTGAGQASANNISSALQGMGNAQAAGAIGSANAWSNALGGLAKQFPSNSSVFAPKQQPVNYTWDWA